MQLALREVLFPRLRGQSVRPSILLMMWEMFNAEHQRTSSPSHSDECDSQKRISRGQALAGKKGAEEVSTCPFHLPVNVKGGEGNHCQSSTKPPDCILYSDMLFFFFFPTGKPNVLAQRDWLIAWLPTPLSPPATPQMSFNPTPVLCLSLPLPLRLHSGGLVFIAVLAD